MRRGLLAGVTGLVVAAILTAVLLSRRTQSGPDVILISVDTLRPDHLGCYGYSRDTSPALDAFAAEATVFDNCYAQAPATRPSVAAMLTGLYPHECRVFTNSDNLPYILQTIPDYLRERGYRTLAVSSNFVLGPNSGFNQGFDVFDHNLEELELVRSVPERIAEKTTDAAVRLLEQNRDGSVFLWIHYQDPHGPYTPPAPFDTAFIDPAGQPRRVAFSSSLSGVGGIPTYQRIGDNDDFNYYLGRYDGEIRYFDVHFRRLLEALKEMGLYDNALIIFTADHGEGMGEHDYYFAHGEYVYNSLIKVPLVVRYGTGSSGRRQDLVALVDVLPTVLAAVGAEPDSGLVGRNLLEDEPRPLAVFSEIEGKYSVVEGGMKLVLHADPQEALLFDLRDDPGEERNLIGDRDYAADLESLAAALDRAAMADRLGQDIQRLPADLTEEDRAKLKSLGYIH
ncbi:MAG: sulfatase [bacterium]